MSESFNGGDLAPKPEQRPGEQPRQAVLGIRTEKLWTIPAGHFCRCGHPIEEHVFLYGYGNHDRYRCENQNPQLRTQCPCGKEYLITAMMVDPSQIDTDEKRTEFIKRMTEAQRKEQERFNG
jgi:hypothetical protein